MRFKKSAFIITVAVFLSLCGNVFPDCLNRNEVVSGRFPISIGNRSPTAVGSSGGPFADFSSKGGLYCLFHTFSHPSGDPAKPFDVQTVEAIFIDSLGSRVQEPIALESGYFLSEPFPTATGLAYNSIKDKFLATWLTRFKNSPISPDIRHQLRAQVLSSSGTLIGSKHILLQTNPSNVSLHVHDSAFDPVNRQYVLLYSLLNASATNERLYLLRISSSGVRIGPGLTINSDIRGVLNSAQIKRDPTTKNFLIAWNVSANRGSVNFFQVLNSKLQKVGANKAFGSSSIEQAPPHITDRDIPNGFIVFWNVGFKGDIEAQLILPNGTTTEPVKKLQLTGFLEDVRFDPPTNTFIALYQKQLGPFPLQKKALMFSRLRTDLRILKKDLRVTCQSASNIAPGASLTPNPGRREVLAVWKFLRQTDITLYDIFGQRLKAE